MFIFQLLLLAGITLITEECTRTGGGMAGGEIVVIVVINTKSAWIV